MIITFSSPVKVDTFRVIVGYTVGGTKVTNAQVDTHLAGVVTNAGTIPWNES